MFNHFVKTLFSIKEGDGTCTSDLGALGVLGYIVGCEKLNMLAPHISETPL